MKRRTDHVWRKSLSVGLSGSGAPELILVRGGRNAYLWAGDSHCLGTLHGPATLRKLAHAILKEIPAPKRATKRAKKA